jgi:hypothetical protein
MTLKVHIILCIIDMFSLYYEEHTLQECKLNRYPGK